jgi:hypothetical protein
LGEQRDQIAVVLHHQGPRPDWLRPAVVHQQMAYGRRETTEVTGTPIVRRAEHRDITTTTYMLPF